MRKLWGLFFLLINAACVVLFVIAQGQGWWLPKNISTFGGDIDHLFNVILGITGATFILVELVMGYFMIKYAGKEGGEKATHVHGNHTAEVVWSLIPAGILLFISLYQFGTWKRVKFTDHFPQAPVHAEILAGQFEWRFTYSGSDKKLYTADDVVAVNELHVPVNSPIILHLKSRDVLHSFFLPNLRLKQDAIPGTTIPIWFQATETGKFDLACAELCGWGHYRMKGRLVVQTQEEFDGWMKKTKEEQEAAK